MKKFSLFSLFISITLNSFTQNFTWIKGSNTTGAANVYGAQNTPAPANTPGERHGCAQWVDNNGNLWLFGGEAPAFSWWNDLWKYNIATNEWTWVRGMTTPNGGGTYGTLGVASSSNEPGAREFPACWTDNAGNFWMFGGRGHDATATVGKLADLWKYNPTTNQWTWMKGPNTITQPGNYGTQGVAAPTNNPGGRSESGFSSDAAGNLWLFGGTGHVTSSIQGRLNDMWKYEIGTNNWTWVSGNNAYGPAGVYGTLSVPASTNHPGGREFPICWLDPSGDIFLFGGQGRDTSVAMPLTGFLNDLWKYNPTANTWVWIGGSKAVNGLASHGALGVPNAANIPGGRRASAHWTDASNNTWVFGGFGIVNNTIPDYLNDLFRYNPNLNEWTWMKGSTLQNQNGIYGTIGVPAPANIPGAREYSIFWTDLNNKFWLFGGEGFDISSTSEGHMNDLWSYSIPCNPDSITVAPGKSICSGTSLVLTAVSGGPGTIWYPTAASTASIAGGSTLAVSTLTTGTSPTTYSYFAETNNCTLTPRASITITVNHLPTLTLSVSHTVICKGETVTLTISGANTYSWNTSPVLTATSIVVSPAANFTYNVTGKDVNNCSSTSSYSVKVSTCLGLGELNTNTVLEIYPNPNKGTFNLSLAEFSPNTKLVIFNAIGQQVFEQEILSAHNTIRSELNKGIYYYQVNSGGKTSAGKLIIE